MKHSVTCPNCKSENPFYNTICSACNFYMREKVVNLDLWKIIALLIESPSTAFRMIIYSEHKNFVIFILIFSAVKLLIDARFVSILTVNDFQSTVGLGISYIIILPALFVIIILLSVLFYRISKIIGIETRIKDFFAVISYLMIPHVFGLVILFPFELIIFGDYLFSTNPSPFIIKEFFAYLFSIIEVLIIAWSIFLSSIAFFVISGSRIIAFSYTIIFYFTIAIILYIGSKIIFTL